MLGESADHDNVLVGALPNPQLIAQAERFGAFRSLPIDLNLPAINRLSREAAGFEEPRGPKPLVEPYVFGRVVRQGYRSAKMPAAMYTQPRPPRTSGNLQPLRLMQQIKGAVLKARLGFIEQHFGSAGLEKVLAYVAAPDRKELERILILGWYPFELGKRLDDAIVTVFGGGDESYFLRLGEASADQNLATLHHAFLVEGNPHAFLAKAPAIYRMYYETGRREYKQAGEREGVLTTYDAETFSGPDCLTVIGWYRRALEMCGARDVMVVEEECRARGGAVCRYRVKWA